MNGQTTQRRVFCILLIGLMLFFPGCSGAGVQPAATATYTPVPPTPVPASPLENIQYLDPNWQLDVSLPESTNGPFPTLLLLHGAGGVYRQSLKSVAEYFTQRGYAAVLADWMVGHDPDWPDSSSNAFCALAWVHSNAEAYKIDADKVFVLGHSAGGYAASIIGTVDDPSGYLKHCPHQLPTSGWTAGVVTYGGVLGTKEVFLTREYAADPTLFHGLAGAFGVSSEEEMTLHETLMNSPYESWSEIGGLTAEGMRLLQCLPPYWVDGSEPPFLLALGEYDSMDPAGHQGFEDHLRATGVEATFSIISGARHESIIMAGSSGFEKTCQAVEAFLAQVLE